MDVHNLESASQCYFKMDLESDNWEGGIIENCYSDGKWSLVEKSNYLISHVRART
jgi:hypothetical protein